MKLGCHAVLFTDQIATGTDSVLAQVEETGFRGVEIGARFFGTERRDYLTELLEAHGLELSAIHVIGVLSAFAEDKEKMFAGILPTIEFASGTPSKNVEMTGMHTPPGSKEPDARLCDPEFAARAARAINELALAAKERGVNLHYHNHWWEFQNDGLIWNALLEEAPALDIGLDVGWAYQSGVDPIRLLEQYPERFHYLHLRDYSTPLGDFVNLGEGDLDFPRLLAAAERALGPDGWAVVEYETGPKNYKRYTTAKIYLDAAAGQAGV